MDDDSLRRRLEALNRGPLPAGDRTPASGRSPQVVRAEKPTSGIGTRSVVKPRAVKSLPGLIRQGEVIHTAAGEHLRIRLPLDSLWPGGTRLVASRQEHLQSLRSAAAQAVEPTVVMDAEFAALVAALPDRVLCLDLETCGLAGAALFLVGLLRRIDDLPTIELLIARNYSEEQAILESLWHTVAGHDVLVTFNGKSFDWPMVADRTARYRLDKGGTNSPLHVDLLHHARRRWRRQLPDCRLQTLEQLVCRRSRTGDIAGHRIPSAYADYVRTGFDRDMNSILYHNAMDLVTLLDLALRLAG